MTKLKNKEQSDPIDELLNHKKFHVGFNAHRLRVNDPYHKKECDFVIAINQEMQFNKSILAQIVNHLDHKEYLEDNEEKVVLSVIQWLGTPVGQNFLEKVSKM